ncbi:MAG: YbaN family protein [Armatimonadetes bacterium]|nr:YbaN family protein [Armatimonadota bacterium]
MKRWLWNLGGLFFVALGFIGYVTPGLPGTVFLIVALWFFKKGSPRFEHWLLNHPWFGRTLRVWEREKAITARTKVIATVSIALAVSASSFAFVGRPLVLGSVVGLGIAGIWYILTRKTADPTLYGKEALVEMPEGEAAESALGQGLEA